ncbi:hypothetical protein N0V93_004885 [Gnomoniopsis smithogilvyi]|uniref:Cytochrome P450 n=1 Tax=Gnomoniopsis smithogilvyi TaxID=1191159 RepID=A0A9W8YTP3_9PEZI|nr:hypothetical protein N0V93_004885 [Gnomoniopsis smithogilvyi]
MTANDLLTWIQTQPLTAILATCLVICITTRLVTSHNAGAQASPRTQNAKFAPAVPYWIPFLGHFPQITLSKDGFLASLRKLYPGGVFSLNILGRTYTVLFKPNLIKSLLAQSSGTIVTSSTSKRLVQTVFGYPRSSTDLALYDTFHRDCEDQYEHLSSEASMKLMVDRATTRLRHNVADFVTFNSGEIDQAPWERLAEAGLEVDADQKEVVEADLFELVRNFVAFTANTAFLGTDFVENFPSFWQALWRLEKGFMPLAIETPVFLPVNSAIGARRSRGFLLGWMDEFETALEKHQKGENPGPQWADLDNVSPIIKGRLCDVWNKHNVGIKQRSAMDLSLIWAMNANANGVIFWVIWRIYSDPWLLIKIREEIEPYVILEKPAVGFGGAFESATRIEKIDLDGLMTNCPYLKAAYIESLRLDVDVWAFESIQKDTVITEPEGGAGVAGNILLEAGTFALGASSLHYTDPTVYEDPLSWKPERHIRWSAAGGKGEKKANVDMSNLEPYTDGEQLGLGKDFAIREIVLFSAAIISMYDIQPIGAGPWKLPKQTTTVGAKRPLTPTRVWIKSRSMPLKTA